MVMVFLQISREATLPGDLRPMPRQGLQRQGFDGHHETAADVNMAIVRSTGGQGVRRTFSLIV